MLAAVQGEYKCYDSDDDAEDAEGPQDEENGNLFDRCIGFIKCGLFNKVNEGSCTDIDAGICGGPVMTGMVQSQDAIYGRYGGYDIYR